MIYYIIISLLIAPVWNRNDINWAEAAFREFSSNRTSLESKRVSVGDLLEMLGDF